MNRECCFVLVPSGRQRIPSGFAINFKRIYRDLVAPALRTARLHAIRGTERAGERLFHTATFDQLLLCEYAVVDLTTADANIFSHIGIRHALRPGKTILILARGSQSAFDASAFGAIFYDLTDGGNLMDTKRVRTALTEELEKAKGSKPSSALFYFLENYTAIAHTKTDVFRDSVHYSSATKSQLAKA
ncbi:MAG TPA: DUF4071 domain-containing protein, partial [Methylomirabilota bacterium]|nr:DUF4071 domain-containing protein [Methylomirabilota bacterium]